jgi:hypothetical protein
LFFKRTDQLAQAGSSKKCVVKKRTQNNNNNNKWSMKHNIIWKSQIREFKGTKKEKTEID